MDASPKLFEEFGLTEKEGGVYLTLLKLERAKVSTLGKKSGFPRTSLYPILEKLLKRGFVRILRIGNHQEWEASEPKEIYKQAKETIKGLEEAVPLLEALKGSLAGHIRTADILFYKSIDGIKKAYDDILKLRRGERVYSIEGNFSQPSKLRRFRKSYMLEWLAKHKKTEVIYEAVESEKLFQLIETIDLELLKGQAGRLVVLTILPDHLMNFDAEIFCFRNTLVIVIVSQDTAIFIHNPEVVEAFRSLFVIAQTLGKKVDFNRAVFEELARRGLKKE
ncbi:MAG: hypothetical protein A3H69_01485 [Candidatus Sungbacteria bacterium RIFCSPLOWO2_02_FULL_47_9]|uniref:Transcription regulator TrmB N-terminal domain-containing protein n=1 Tax=Candidatus Sungbacteria bacterium RIFCSPHIGHO2_01_FULL_47_32 TaxID=1802264 RepID=A0A1G2K683_9BACT|nr:MAG: Transcriptional regulator, TrmB [Parcubacteria group bacterium GW2011_GWA2_47_10]OGZ94693.1 MAG: hypothetical protein A2633_02620 [Candidatus Sungbacteria bacterium RIFCSPHIGHO2_01_FULL_47_32]OGZ99544.1 MAG: hypothetical protein A3D57_00350 [Candidatus Sungbacteria bacterium RIFCSPHIGHO2_02_FULL_46_12]OHA05205.1 MAG: hypothetical protein A3A28_01955 [Candidatus Sungbacteria bacterium RIFCSPLOWO2_01_FULL_47_32]OHA11814.1 MAG: hypothetical protein A3H69_01485 [Candidatus Sungbacteria bact